MPQNPTESQASKKSSYQLTFRDFIEQGHSLKYIHCLEVRILLLEMNVSLG